MKTKLKILIENAVFQPEAKAELGFSLYIEAEDKKILFDTGQSGLFADNAQLFDIDVASLDILVLSHGHYDHTGGLERFLSLNKKAKIYAKKGYDQAKYSGTERYIGKPLQVDIPKERLVYVEEPTEIAEGITIMPEIKIFDQDDTHFTRLNKMEGDQLVTDQFDDELYIALVKNGKLTIVSGCAHRGISNVVRSAQEHFPLPIDLIIGGMHTLHEEPAKLERLADQFNRLKIGRMVPCHCTGINQYAILKSRCSCPVEYGHVGMNVFLE